MVTKQDVIDAARELGIQQGDIALIHSSFKSFGPVENGADTIVSGFLEALGPEGTLVFPTLCQADWAHVYENWNLDAHSDVGYLTNYFRKLPGAKRSDQATHSVAAIGKYADYLTRTHGQSGLRHGIFGSSPFSADSPWEKMYEKNAKILFVGVGMIKCTFRHYTEYCFMDKHLRRAEGTAQYEELKHALWCYDRWDDQGVWPHISNNYIHTLMDSAGQVTYAQCGDARIICINAADFVDLTMRLLDEGHWESLGGGAKGVSEWLEKIAEAEKSKKSK